MKAKNKLRIAIQKSGRLKEQTIDLLEKLGLKFEKNIGRNLIAKCQNANIEIIFVRHKDIPEYVQGGTADFGVVGQNLLFENTYNTKTIKDLGFGKCKLIIATKKTSYHNSIDDLDGERIATSYPNSLKKFLKKNQINASIINISGSVEVAIELGLADAICDITQTGNTLKDHDLDILTEILESQATIIQSPFLEVAKDQTFEDVIQSIIE